MILTSEQIKSSHFITSDFEEPVLYMPARKSFSLPCQSLKIITAFTDCERISTHAIKLSEGIKNNCFEKDLSVEILLGMTKSSLSQKKHEDICRILRFLNQSKEMPKISCRYIYQGAEVHSKIYLWSHKDENKNYNPCLAFCGSLNYTMNAFYKRREAVSICNAEDAYKYYSELIKDTISCYDPSATEKLKKITNKLSFNEDVENDDDEYSKYDQMKPIDSLRISLLKADESDTGYGSGINWGIRKDGTKRNKNQAYIPYNKNDRKVGFFPDRIDPAMKIVLCLRLLQRTLVLFI